jgi:hypothetical protein
MRITAVFLLLLSLLPTAILAADNNNNYAIWGMGRKVCNNYNKAREAEDYVRYKDYLMGYLTAYNKLAQDTYRVSGKKDLNEILEWMDEYCETKQIHSFESAVTDFIIEHTEDRIKRSPSKFLR